MARKPFEGATRRLLLAFDIGTTFSGVSYSIMDPGEVPEIRTVTRFPAQAQSGGDCKIPSIIYYDTQGKVCVVGAEATAEGIEEQAEDNGWFKAEWFKLHLRPQGQRSNLLGPAIPPLPPRKTALQLFADYMKYLFDCSETYIKETHTSGDLLWNTLKDDILFVLTHPNGWEGPQQTQMRRAAVQAGLVSDSEEGHARVMFVTEGEASLHFCINNGLSGDGLESGKGVVIVDAGGGTIDVSAYQGRGGVFNEISAAQCHFQGSVFVTSRAEEYMKQHLNGTRFEADIPVIVKRFDTRTKHTFRSDSEMQFIQFGSPRETDLALDIRRGQMKLKGSVVAGFFEPSIKCIVGAVEEQMANRHYPISTVFLVGGFAASDWLYNQVKNRLERRGVKVFRPDTHTNKAVSDGAASFYLDHLVGTRVSKFDYGLNSFVFFDPYDPEHFKRRSKMREHSITRHLILNDCFSVILFRGTQVAERTEFRGRYDHWLKPNEDLTQFRVYIQCYRGDGPCPEWMDGEDSNSFSQVCCVTADVSSIVPAWQFSPLTGQYHSRIAFDVVLLFGLTELRAQIAWMVNGVEKRGPAKIVYL